MICNPAGDAPCVTVQRHVLGELRVIPVLRLEAQFAHRLVDKKDRTDRVAEYFVDEAEDFIEDCREIKRPQEMPGNIGHRRHDSRNAPSIREGPCDQGSRRLAPVVRGARRLARRRVGVDHMLYHHLTERLDDRRVELRPGVLADLCDRLITWTPFAIGPIVHDRAEGIGHREDTDRERNVRALQAVRIPRTIPSLLVVTNDRGHALHAVHKEQDLLSDHGMSQHHRPLLVRERPLLSENFIRHSDLANVVQQSGPADVSHLVVPAPHSPGQGFNPSRQFVAVRPRIGISGVNRARQREDSLEIRLLESVVQAGPADGGAPDLHERRQEVHIGVGKRLNASDALPCEGQRAADFPLGSHGHDENRPQLAEAGALLPSPRGAGREIGGDKWLVGLDHGFRQAASGREHRSGFAQEPRGMDTP